MVYGLYVGQLPAVELACAHHKHGEVGNAVGDGGIGNDAHGHAVGYDDVVTPAQLGDELVEAFVHEQLGGVGGYLARRYHVKPLVMAYDVVHLDFGVGQIVGHSAPVAAIVAAERALAYVEVDQHHALACVDEAHGEVARDECLARSLVERCEGDDLHGVVAPRHERHVGAQHAECFGRDAVFIGHGVLPCVFAAVCRRLPVERYLAQERHAEGFLHLLAAVHPCVEEQHHEASRRGQSYAYEQSEQQYAVALRRYGRVGTVGAVDDAGIVVGHGLCQCVFLALVEQEEVEGLFYLLLSLYGEHLSLFGRYGRDALLRLLLACLRIVALHVEADYHVVYRADDVLLHGAERVVQLEQHGVVFAAVVHEPVAAQLGVVVDIYLILYVHVADACVGRYQVCLLSGVGEVVLDEVGQAQLRLQLHGIGVVLLRLAHVHACR